MLPVGKLTSAGFTMWHREKGKYPCTFSLRIWKGMTGYTLKVHGYDDKVKYTKGVRGKVHKYITYGEVSAILQKEFNLEVK